MSQQDWFLEQIIFKVVQNSFLSSIPTELYESFIGW